MRLHFNVSIFFYINSWTNYTEEFYLSEIFPFKKKKNRRDKWEVKKKSKQNELQRWRCRPCLCNENYGLCCQNEAFIEKKSGKETRGWGVGLWKEIKKKPIQIYCKNSFCRIMNISESIWVWIQQRLRYFSFFGVYIHLFYFKQWIGFF